MAAQPIVDACQVQTGYSSVIPTNDIVLTNVYERSYEYDVMYANSQNTLMQVFILYVVHIMMNSLPVLCISFVNSVAPTSCLNACRKFAYERFVIFLYFAYVV